MKKNISTLSELEATQDQLRQGIELTQHELMKSLNGNKKLLKSFMLKNVAIPTGVIGLGTAAINTIVKNSDQKTKQTKVQSSLLKKALPFLIKLAQAYSIKNVSKLT